MMKRYFLIGLILSFACTGNQRADNDHAVADSTILTADTKPDTTEISKDPKAETEEENDGCVFNSDYKGLTTDWLTKLGKTNFTWRQDALDAAIVEDGDSVFLTIGGCNHFGETLIQKLTNDNHSLSDSVFWTNHIIELSAEFGFDEYSNFLKNGQFKIESNGDQSILLSIEQNDSEVDNIVYDGISISIKGKERTINVSQYYN